MGHGLNHRGAALSQMAEVTTVEQDLEIAYRTVIETTSLLEAS